MSAAQLSTSGLSFFLQNQLNARLQKPVPANSRQVRDQVQQLYVEHGPEWRQWLDLQQVGVGVLGRSRSVELQAYHAFFVAAADAMRNFLRTCAAELHEDDDALACADAFRNFEGAVQALVALDARVAEVVKLRLFAGLFDREIAVLLDCSANEVRARYRTGSMLLQKLMRLQDEP